MQNFALELERERESLSYSEWEGGLSVDIGAESGDKSWIVFVPFVRDGSTGSRQRWI